MKLSGKIIALTGAASGIGRALAIALVRRGAIVAAADLDGDGLQETQALAIGNQVDASRFSVHRLDVRDLDQWRAYRRDVIDRHGTVDGIINNAGITSVGTVANTPYDQLDKVMAINFMGQVYGCREFLAELSGRDEAFIVNVSSLLGLVPRKEQAAYCASKFAIRGYSEVLAQELRDTHIHVATVFPGHVGTNILTNATKQGNVSGMDLSDEQAEMIASYFKNNGVQPEKAAEIILDGIEKHRSRILIGRDASRLDRFSRFLPKIFARSSATG